MVFYLILHIKSAWLRRIVILFLGLICLVTILMVYTDILDALWQDGSFAIRYNLIRWIGYTELDNKNKVCKI